MILREYGVAATLEIPVVIAGDTALAASTDYTPASGDAKISKNGGTLANLTTTPSFVGGSGSKLLQISLSATEMQAERVVVQIVDTAIEDQFVMIETYGHSSATHEMFPCDVKKIDDDDDAADKLGLMCAAIQIAIVASGSTTTLIKTNRIESDNFWNDQAIVFTSGSLHGVTRRVINYSNTDGTFTVNVLPAAPSASDTIIFTGRVE